MLCIRADTQQNNKNKGVAIAMKTNTVIYAVLHGQIIETLLVGVNKVCDIAYIRHENRTVRITPDSIFETKQAAENCLAAL